MPHDTSMLKLAFGLNFADLYATAGLARVDASFLAFLRAADAGLAERLVAARADRTALDRGDESALLIAIAPHLEDFVALLFGVEAEVAALQKAQHELAPLYACKRQVVQRKAMNKYKAETAAAFDGHTRARLAHGVSTKPRTAPISTWRFAMPRGRRRRRPARRGTVPACCSRRRASSITCA
jgi:hypothetical protein